MLRSGVIFNSELCKMNFIDWKKGVNDIIFKEIKMNCCDLPDEDYWMNWDKGITPMEMSNIILNDLKKMDSIFMDVFIEHARLYKKK